MLSALMLLAAVPNCDDPQTQSAMTACAGAAFKAADVALNAQWKVTHGFMKERDAAIGAADADGRPGYAAALLEAQRAWLEFRDAQCGVEGYAARGGSMEPMLVNSCLADLTRRRTDQLKDLVWEH